MSNSLQKHIIAQKNVCNILHDNISEYDQKKYMI